MIDRLNLFCCDYKSSRNFYQTILPQLGYEIQFEFRAEGGKKVCAFGPKGQPIFWLVEREKQAEPIQLAFKAPTRESVDNFFEAGKQWKKENGEPGIRQRYHAHYYASDLVDPEGNEIEAVDQSIPV